MSELRQDRTTGAWVIIAPERRRRPRGQMVTRRGSPAAASDCPFCPGNEQLLPEIIDEIRQDAPPGWRARVVSNLYPAVGMHQGGGLQHAASHRAIPGCGRHEVIVETPRHDAGIAGFTDAEIDAAVSTYHRRYVALSKFPGIEAVVVFRNQGRVAGASLNHPHAQIIGLCVTPPKWQSTANWARAEFRDSGRCVTCEEIAEERQGVRAIEDTDGFVALVPYAATVPCEIWLVPKRHEASFGAARREELAGLGRLLRRSMGRIEAVLGAVHSNFVIDSATRRSAGAPHLHWKLRIVPGLVTPGGFELGTGLPINPSLPEADAEALRNAAGKAII